VCGVIFLLHEVLLYFDDCDVKYNLIKLKIDVVISIHHKQLYL